MRLHNPYEPYVGQTWTTSQSEHFIITQLTDTLDPWVHYQKVKTKQSYNCRLEAFKERFSPLAE